MLEKITENIHENKESDKLLNPEEYFQKIVNNERKSFDVEKIFKDARERDMKEEDIETAVDLLACISVLDEKIFPNEKPIPIDLVATESSKNHMVNYSSSDNKNNERYNIYIKNITEFSSKSTPSVKKLNENNELDTSEKWVKSIQELLLLSVAVHEIRHRLQKKNKIKQFNPKHTLSFQNKIYPDFIDFMNLYIESIKEISQEEGLSEERAEYRARPLEYDAYLIEEFARSKLFSGITEKDLIEIIQLEPKE